MRNLKRRPQVVRMLLAGFFVAGLPLAGLTAAQATQEKHTLNEHVQLQGTLTQGALVVGKTEPGFQVRLNGEELTVGEHGYFVFGLAREADTEQTLVVTDASGNEHRSTIDVAAREFDIQRIDGLPQQTVTPDPEAQARIQAENRQIAAARQVRSEMTYFAGPYMWPAEGRISGVYGSQRILNGEPRAPHWGMDIAAPTGTPVYAPINGVVVLAHPDMLMSGGTLIVDHGHGVFSSFLHLHRIYVDVGDYLKQGDPIAEIGATGRATGPHLDWRMNWEATRVDPQLLLPARD